MNPVILDRRKMVGLMSAAIAQRALGQDASFSVKGIEHVSIQAADLNKSVSFYRRVFSAELFKESASGRRFVVIGGSYLSIAQAKESLSVQRRVDHIAPYVDGFEAGRLKVQFEQKGLYPRITDGSLFVKDPNGIEVQFTGGESWKQSPSSRDEAEPEFP